MLKVAKTLYTLVGEFPFIGNGNIWIRDSVKNRDSILLTQSLVMDALEQTTPGQLSVTFFDETLSGLSSPFVAANDGGSAIVESLHDINDLSVFIKYLREHIQNVNNVIQGRTESLITFRERLEFPVESYKLVVISTDIMMLAEDLQNDLMILLRSGPRAGVSFLIHSLEIGAENFLSLCSRLHIQNGALIDPESGFAQEWHAISAHDMISSSTAVAGKIRSTAVATVPFDSVQHLESKWEGSSAEGLSFALGRFGPDAAEVTLGDDVHQRHNILVTGAVGQGKSNILSVIIHSMAQRYSPEELNFFLLDFKEGVTLQRFIDSSSGVYLPHASVLGLEADRHYGLSVLKHLFGVYKLRMKQFKNFGANDIKEFRALTGQPMARIVVVIDEFQMMFSENDIVSSESASLLVKAVRLFRASGIHFILASQTIGGNMALIGSAADGLFGQVPIRIALKNSLAESHATLGHRNDAAAYLRPREAILNQNYGDLSSNQKISVAFADEKLLAGLRYDWWSSAGSVTSAPSVFAGDKSDSVSEVVERFTNRSARSVSPSIYLGESIEVGGRPLRASMESGAGRNVAIIGSGGGYQLLFSIALSMAIQDSSNKFAVVDLLGGIDDVERELEPLVNRLQVTGAQVLRISGENIASELESIYDSILLAEPNERGNWFILCAGLERFKEIPQVLERIYEEGNVFGVHVIGWWRKHSSFKSHLGYSGDPHFDVRVALQMEPQSMRDFMSSPLLNWEASEYRILGWDRNFMSNPASLIPYRAE
ncbi:FtsK/SpoIIIE domain-containing protein [Glutamicibacter sp. NPDC087344]|uniref:FtsK/SpoIIIE domain-containing protein n=1 Tax=Glutamicibacter sp. NPDC087344 TaxID=3363994 RepID=UPI003821A544